MGYAQWGSELMVKAKSNLCPSRSRPTELFGNYVNESESKISELKVVYNQAKQKRYERGAFIGKGQIGQCYELVDTDTQGQAVYAAKIVPQSLLVTSVQNGNWKRKWEQKTHQSLVLCFFHSVLLVTTLVFYLAMVIGLA